MYHGLARKPLHLVWRALPGACLKDTVGNTRRQGQRRSRYPATRKQEWASWDDSQAYPVTLPWAAKAYTVDAPA